LKSHAKISEPENEVGIMLGSHNGSIPQGASFHKAKLTRDRAKGKPPCGYLSLFFSYSVLS
jgi:hypothetical protein